MNTFCKVGELVTGWLVAGMGVGMVIQGIEIMKRTGFFEWLKRLNV